MKPVVGGLKWALLIGVLALSACGKKNDNVLNVYNWSDYKATDTVENFESRYGIKVNYDVFDSNDVVQTKMLAGSTGYDIVVPSAQFMARQIKAGVYRKLDKSQLKNLGNLDPDIMKAVAVYDPGNEYAVPYLWSTDGIGYNVDKIKSIMPDTPVDSWKLVFDPQYAAKFKDCGISFLDAPAEMRSLVLIYLGKDANSQNAEDLKLVEEMLSKIRPFIRKINSSQYIEDLANGDLCIAVGYSGDVRQSHNRAKEAGKGIDVAYSLPKEGSVISFDMMVIPADAKHVKNALLFIDYVMQPQVIADVSNEVHYPNGNLASEKLIREDVKSDTNVFPTAEVRKRLSPELPTNDEYERSLSRMWTRFQTGQ